MPDISIVTVTFNAEKHIGECLESVASQRDISIQHLIIDGGSTDRTVEIAAAYPHVSAIHSEADEGIYDAMNKGASLAKGRFLLFLNSDDRLASRSALADALIEIDKTEFADVYYGSLLVQRVTGECHTHVPQPAEKAAEVLICGCLPHQSTLVRLEIWNKIGGFNLAYKLHSDYQWFLRVVENPEICLRRINTVIGCFREGGLSTQKFEEAQREIYEIQSKSTLYQTPHWQTLRLNAFQEGFLQVRMENMRLKETINSTPSRVVLHRLGLKQEVAKIKNSLRRLARRSSN